MQQQATTRTERKLFFLSSLTRLDWRSHSPSKCCFLLFLSFFLSLVGSRRKGRFPSSLPPHFPLSFSSSSSSLFDRQQQQQRRWRWWWWDAEMMMNNCLVLACVWVEIKKERRREGAIDLETWLAVVVSWELFSFSHFGMTVCLCLHQTVRYQKPQPRGKSVPVVVVPCPAHSIDHYFPVLYCTEL